MSELLALADRVDAASVADVCLTKDIFRAIFPERVPTVVPHGQYGWRDDSAGWWLATGEDSRIAPKTIYPPNWLGSLDAALSLYLILPNLVPSCPRKATADALRQRAGEER